MLFRGRQSLAVRVAAAFAAALVAFAAVARGAELCLCNPDPDNCGHVCHDCGASAPAGISHAEGCHHLAFAAIDVENADAVVPLPSAPQPQAFAVARGVGPLEREVPVPCAASPPERVFSICRSICRLCPRS